MIIVYENNCQVQSDIFFVREESKNIDKQAWKFDINSGAREPAYGRGDGESRSKSAGVLAFGRTER
jgi:hypothetical protein